MTSASVEVTIQQIFTLAKVERVISIDDMNGLEAPIDEALTAVQLLDNASVENVFKRYPSVLQTDDVDIRAKAIRTIWENEPVEVRRLLLTKLNSLVQRKEEPKGAETPAAAIDDSTFIELPTFFSKYKLELLSLAGWRERRAEVLKEDMPVTLLLIDEDFSREKGGAPRTGIALIKEVINNAPRDKVLCALLSHNRRYRPDAIHESWKKLCEDEGLDKSRVVLIPKILVQDEPMAFARLVKLALLNGKAEQLKEIALEVLHASEEEARKRLDAIDIYDFDQIVFRSSHREGVWEPDTLFRVFGLFHHDETRKLAKTHAGLRNIADEVRQVSLVHTKSPSAPNYNTIAVQRLELYEKSDYLNGQLTPVEVGDIFEKLGGSNKRFILLGQPCDLMVRSDGKRNHLINEAVVAEIVHGPIKDYDGHALLPYLDTNPSRQWFVRFKASYSVLLCTLDLCSFNANGEASINVKNPCPERLIPSWKRRYEELVRETNRLLANVEAVTKKGMPLKQAAAILAKSSNSSLFVPTVDVAAGTLKYNLQRVARLRQPRAAALLTRYSNFLARYAFEHEFGDREEPTPHTDQSEMLSLLRDEIVGNIADGQQKLLILERLDKLVASRGTPSFAANLADFVLAASTEIAILTPFIVGLHELMKKELSLVASAV